MARLPRSLAATAIAALVVLGAAAAVHADATPSKPGAKYTGKTAQGTKLTLMVSGKKVDIVAFEFNCGRKTVGATSLQDLPLKRTDAGYTFNVSANGIVSYRDEQPDENAEVAIRGRFSRSAKTVAGVLRVASPRCHHTGPVDWRAKLSAN
jgi:hypothetical protein